MPDGVTEDRFLDGRVLVGQPVRTARAGIDAVLLAAAVPVVAGGSQSVLDVGSGTGVVSLLIAHHSETARITGVEADPGLVALAIKNADRNGFGGRVTFIHSDILEPSEGLSALGLSPETFDIAVSNPPFFARRHGTVPATAQRARAHVMPEPGLAAWLDFMTRVTKQKGQIALIHRAEALPEILIGLDRRFGDIRVLPLHPKPGQPANRVIVIGTRNARGPFKLLPGFVLHHADGSFRDEATAILRHGARLPLF